VLVRPRRSLLTTAFVSILLAMLPVFGVLYWFAAQHGTWVAVLAFQIVLTIAAVLALARQLTVYTAVTPTTLKGRGIFSPMETILLDQIASVTIIPTLSGQATEPVTQLLVRDVMGRRLFRMRGNFWHAGDLHAVAETLPVETTVIPEAITIGEFYRLYPGSAYWFESRPMVRIGLGVAGGIVVLGVAAIIGVLVGAQL
jgi:hypothetical protein